MTALLRHPKASRAAALAIPAILLLALLALAGQAFFSARHDRRSAEQRDLKALEVYRRAADGREEIERELQSLRNGQSSAPGLWPGASAPLSAAALQGEVRRIVESGGGEIKSAQMVPAAAGADGLERIEVRYSVMATLTGVTEMIYLIETHTPYLFLDQVELRGPEGAASDGKTDVKLTVRWSVHGYRWVGAK